jgi:hypothetical protein
VGSLNYTTVGKLKSLRPLTPMPDFHDIKGSSTGEGQHRHQIGLRPHDTEKASYKGTTTVKQMGQETSIPMTIDSESTTIMTW